MKTMLRIENEVVNEGKQIKVTASTYILIDIVGGNLKRNLKCEDYSIINEKDSEHRNFFLNANNCEDVLSEAKFTYMDPTILKTLPRKRGLLSVLENALVEIDSFSTIDPKLIVERPTAWELQNSINEFSSSFDKTHVSINSICAIAHHATHMLFHPKFMDHTLLMDDNVQLRKGEVFVFAFNCYDIISTKYSKKISQHFNRIRDNYRNNMILTGLIKHEKKDSPHNFPSSWLYKCQLEQNDILHQIILGTTLEYPSYFKQAESSTTLLLIDDLSPNKLNELHNFHIPSRDSLSFKARKEITKIFEKILRRILKMTMKENFLVEHYGSDLSNVALEDSDFDLSISSDETTTKKEKCEAGEISEHKYKMYIKGLMYTLKVALEKQGKINVYVVMRAKAPVMKGIFHNKKKSLQ